jgi:AbrB family looped-hinge helix DNA binding protein
MLKLTQTTLSEAFEVSIPEAIRGQLELRAGQRFVVLVKGESIVLVPKRSSRHMRGFMRGARTENYRDRY